MDTRGEADQRKAAPEMDGAVIEAWSAQSPIDHAQALLERFQLTGSEAKIVVALVRLGSATPNQLAPLTGIARPNVYRVLDLLKRKDLVAKMPGRNAVWMLPERDELIARLGQREQQRFDAAQVALEQARVALERVPVAEAEATAVFSVNNEISNILAYEEALASVSEELLVFNRGPFSGELVVDDAVIAAVGRGVAARAIWQAAELEGPKGAGARDCAVGYAEAGVATRVVESLPLSLAVIDRRLAFLDVPGDEQSDLAYVANVAVDNRSFAGVMAEVFDLHWRRGTSLDVPGGVRSKGPRP